MAVSCGVPIQNMEVPTVLLYRPGQELANRDASIDLTFLVCLNDDYEGGETDFPELGVRHRGTKGTVSTLIRTKTCGLAARAGG